MSSDSDSGTSITNSVASSAISGHKRGRLAEAGLVAAVVASIASLGLSVVLTDRLFSLAFVAAGGLAVYGIVAGAGWASASAAVGQAILGLVVADGRSTGAAISITAFYAIIATLLLCATHISFLGRRATQFAPPVLSGYLRISALTVAVGLVLSSAIVLVAETSTWPTWLFPVGLLLVAITLGLGAGQINRHHHELGAHRRRF